MNLTTYDEGYSDGLRRVYSNSYSQKDNYKDWKDYEDGYHDAFWGSIND